jgi:YidC/Oxa1 family membrane protein insertase
MERNTVIAVALCSLVLIGSFALQGFFSQQQHQAHVNQAQDPSFVSETDTMSARINDVLGSETTAVPGQDTGVLTQPSSGEAPVAAERNYAAIQEVDVPVEHVTINTELITVVLTNAGGNIISWELKDHLDKNVPVEMLFSGDSEAYAFNVGFSGLDARPVYSNFHIDISRIQEHIVEFSNDYNIFSTGGITGSFRLIKRYEFQPKDYMFKLSVIITDMQSITGIIGTDGKSYTLSFGPQIGPTFEKLDFYDFRENHIYKNGKLEKVRDNHTERENRTTAWASISGKYFVFIAMPSMLTYYSQYDLEFSDADRPSGVSKASRLSIIRPALNILNINDVYFFYLGPKTQDALRGHGNNLEVIASSRGILAPLENILKWLLLFFYGIVRNYGIAIILLTLLIKILFFPLTKKGSEATLRMQALAPKIKEIQDKYKDNRQKLQMEMGNFYKQEGYNPLSGCLPLLLQIPIFIAMYSLFNNHFDLRGAGFIPGWIPDLSVPEHIPGFENFLLPFLGSPLRGLPFIYVASQLLYGKVTQMPGQQSNKQMKFMLFVMPIIFFFVLYNVPSGLLIYWIFSNLLTLVQQLIINKFVLAKRAAQAKAEPAPKIAPGKNKKKNF